MIICSSFIQCYQLDRQVEQSVYTHIVDNMSILIEIHGIDDFIISICFVSILVLCLATVTGVCIMLEVSAFIACKEE